MLPRPPVPPRAITKRAPGSDRSASGPPSSSDTSSDTSADTSADTSKITVPTIALQGEADGVAPAQAFDPHAGLFAGPYQRRLLPKVGHNPPQEAPGAFADAILELTRGARL